LKGAVEENSGLLGELKAESPRSEGGDRKVGKGGGGVGVGGGG